MFLLFTLYMILIALISNCSADNKICKMSELESKLKPLVGLYGLRDMKFSETERQMDQWCSSVHQNSLAAKNFVKKCLRGLSKTIMSASIFSADKVNVKQYCNNKAMRKDFLSRSKCGNKGKKNTAKCWNSLINGLSNVKNESDEKNRIPFLCCHFYEWKTCTINVYKNIGQPFCSENAIEGHEQSISRASLDPLNVLCGDFDDESDKCENITKLIPKSRSNRTRNKTPFPALIDVFDSL